MAKDRPAARIGMGLTFEPEIDTKGLKNTVDSAWNAVSSLLSGNILGFAKQTNSMFKSMGLDIGGTLKQTLFSKFGNFGKGAGEAAKGGIGKLGSLAADAVAPIEGVGDAMGSLAGQAGKAAGGLGGMGSKMSALFSGPQAIVALAAIALAALVAVTIKCIAIFEEWKKEINKFAPALSANRNEVYDTVMALEVLGMQSGFSAQETDKLAEAIAGVDESLLMTEKGFAKTVKILPQLQKFQKLYGLSVGDSASLLGLMTNNLSMSGDEANKFLDTLSTLTVATNLNAKEVIGLIEKNKTLFYLFKKSAPELVSQMATIQGAFKSVGESADSTFKTFEAGLDMTNAKGVTTVAIIASMAGKTLSDIKGPMDLMEAELTAIENKTKNILDDPRALATSAGIWAKNMGKTNEEFIAIAHNVGKLREELKASEQRMVKLGDKSAGVNAQWEDSTNQLSFLWQNIQTLFGQALKESLVDVMKFLGEGAKSLNSWLVVLKSNDEQWQQAVAVLKFILAPVRVLVKAFTGILFIFTEILRIWDALSAGIKAFTALPAWKAFSLVFGSGINPLAGIDKFSDSLMPGGLVNAGEITSAHYTGKADARRKELASMSEETARQKAENNAGLRKDMNRLISANEEGNSDRKRGNRDRRSLSDPYLGSA